MMTAPLIGVLDVQGAVTEHIDAMHACGVDVRRVRLARDFDGIDGLIIPGGESTTLCKLLTIFDMWNPMAKLLSEGLPVYGSCAGMILLAKEVLDTRADARSFGTMNMTVRTNPVAVRQGAALATSFHPELVADRRFHQYFLSIVQGTA